MRTIKWGVTSDSRNPLSDPRLSNLYFLVREFHLGRLPIGWRGNSIFDNRWGDLPSRPNGYYREFYLGNSAESGSLRVVLGDGSEVYITGNHYRDFIQVLNLPFP